MNWTNSRWKTSAHLTARQRENLIIVRLRFQTQSIKLTELDWISDSGSVAAVWGGTSGDDQTCKPRLTTFRMESTIFGKDPFFLYIQLSAKVRLGKVPLFPSHLCGSPNITDMFGGCPGEVNCMIDSVAGVRCLVHGHTGAGHHFPRSREIHSKMFYYFYMVLLAFQCNIGNLWSNYLWLFIATHGQ